MDIKDTLANSAWDGSCADSTQFAALPPGVYNGVIMDWSVKHLGDKGTPALVVQLEVVDGPHQGNYAWKTFWLTDKALPHVARYLKALGHPIAKATDVLTLRLAGTGVKFKYDIPKDKEKPEVMWLNPSMEGAPAHVPIPIGTQVTEDAIPF